MPGASVKQYQETSYAATSLSRDRATAPQLLRAWRGRWQVEALHWVRDVTFGEDLSSSHGRCAKNHGFYSQRCL
jgi:hypothetical protein